MSNREAMTAEYTRKLHDEIEELKRQLEEAKWQAAFDGKLLNHIESELIGVQYVGPYDAGIRAIKQQLAESQAREARRLEALKFLDMRIITTDLGGVVEKALALPHDDTALKEYRDAVIDDYIATAMVAGVDGAINIANDLREMKGSA